MKKIYPLMILIISVIVSLILCNFNIIASWNVFSSIGFNLAVIIIMLMTFRNNDTLFYSIMIGFAAINSRRLVTSYLSINLILISFVMLIFIIQTIKYFLMKKTLKISTYEDLLVLVCSLVATAGYCLYF